MVMSLLSEFGSYSAALVILSFLLNAKLQYCVYKNNFLRFLDISFALYFSKIYLMWCDVNSTTPTEPICQ
jgi:hypothetical protein